MSADGSPRLLADIGATFARFALERAPGQFDRLSQLRCADHPDFLSALKAYLDAVAGEGVRHAAIAIANPVEGDLVRMTNYRWQFSIEDIRSRADLETLLVVNDFTALASSLPHLSGEDLRQIGGGAPVERSVKGVIGAGTGLGVSGLIPAEDGWISLGSEGGHVSYAPQDEIELEILQQVWRKYPHASAERLLSGPGLQLIYGLFAKRAGKRAESISSRDIVRRGIAGDCAICAQTVALFCAMLGSVAGNLALTLGAFGGIYVGGAIVPAFGAAFEASSFRSRFESKGRFAGYLAAIPTYVIKAERATFVGASAILDAQLRRRAGSSSIIDRIRRILEQLSPAERRVAELVLNRPRSVLKDPISDIAVAAQVSQPTVIRFCRSLGCQGLPDFKLRLASSLTGTIPVMHTQVTHSDTTLELGAKVLGNTASAILQVRDQLNRESIDRAIGLLLQARRIEFYAVGNYGIVAQDAQYKFLRFGISAVAYTDTRLQLMAASALTPQDVVVVTSSSGKIGELLEAVDRAVANGAAVIAITASQSPLAKRATVTIAVDHGEDVTTQVPMVSRILHLLIVDILAVGVAMRESNQNNAKADALPESAQQAPGETVERLGRDGRRRRGDDLRRIVPHSG